MGDQKGWIQTEVSANKPLKATTAVQITPWEMDGNFIHWGVIRGHPVIIFVKSAVEINNFWYLKMFSQELGLARKQTLKFSL